MVEFQTGRRISVKKVLFSWPTLAICLIILTLLANKTFRSWRDYRVILQEHRRLQQEYAETEESKRKIEENLALLQDEYGRDRIMREHFSLQGKDEKTIIIIDDDGRSGVETEANPALSLFSKLKNFIFGIFLRD